MLSVDHIEDLRLICLGCLKALGGEKAVYGWHEDCFTKQFRSTKMERWARLKTQVIGSWDDSIRDPQMQGAYPKYSFDLAGENYICKIGKSDEYPLLPLGEYVCNEIGRLCGLPISSFHLIWHRERPCFLTKNFISKTQVQTLIHLFHYWPKSDNPTDYPYTVSFLIELIEKTSTPQDAITVAKLILYDYLIGNNDRHRSNIAFISAPSGIRLSPIYDNVTELAMERDELIDTSLSYHPSLKMDCKAHSTEIVDYIKDLKEVGASFAVKKFQTILKSKKSLIENTIDSYPLTPNFRVAFKKMVVNRCQDILRGR